MRRFILIVIAGAVMAVVAAGCAPKQQPRELKVLTYNVHNGRGMDSVVDYARIADIVVNSRADVVAIRRLIMMAASMASVCSRQRSR